MPYETGSNRRYTDTWSDAPVNIGLSFVDWMLSLQKASLNALSDYGTRSDYDTRSDYGARYDQRTAKTAERSTNAVEVIPVGEETLNVGTRTVQGDTTRLRRVVVETPVERQVSLREEKVIVERRKPTASSAMDTLTEKAVEMTDTFEVADVWKSVHLREEIVLRKQVTERTETVRDTVRRDEVKVEHAGKVLPAPRHEAEIAKFETKLPAPQQDKQLAAPQPENRQEDKHPAPHAVAEAMQEAKKFGPAPQDKKPENEQNDKKPAVPHAEGAQHDKGPARKS